jgi:hypothetical protein
MKIDRDKFELYETCILTEQVPQHDVPKLLAENPEFDVWYRTRLLERRNA